MRHILIALVCLPLAACDPSAYKALDTLTEQSTGHATTATTLLDANSQPPEALVASSASSAAPVVQTAVVEASSSSVYVPPLTEPCQPGEFQFRVWACDATGHRAYI